MFTLLLSFMLLHRYFQICTLSSRHVCPLWSHVWVCFCRCIRHSALHSHAVLLLTACLWHNPLSFCHPFLLLHQIPPFHPLFWNSNSSYSSDATWWLFLPHVMSCERHNMFLLNALPYRQIHSSGHKSGNSVTGIIVNSKKRTKS